MLADVPPVRLSATEHTPTCFLWYKLGASVEVMRGHMPLGPGSCTPYWLPHLGATTEYIFPVICTNQPSAQASSSVRPFTVSG